MKSLVAFLALSLISFSATSVPDYDVGKNKSELSIICSDAVLSFEFSVTPEYDFNCVQAVEYVVDSFDIVPVAIYKPELKAYKKNIVVIPYRSPRDAI